MTTRFAIESDIPEIVRIINLAYRVEDFFVIGDRTSSTDIAERMSNDDTHIIVVDAADSRGLAGAVVVDVHDNLGHFAMLSVDPSVQGRGLGRELINAVEHHCKAAGCTTLELEVVDLRDELPPFYEALGFIAHAELLPFTPASKLRRDAHFIRMTKPLSAATSPLHAPH